MVRKHITAEKQPETVETGQTEDQMRITALERQMANVLAVVAMLRNEVVRLERHQMIGVNPDLIVRGK